MNLFIVAVNREAHARPEKLEGALRHSAEWIPALARESVLSSVSRSGRIAIASVSAGTARGRRDYRLETDDEIIVWDGLPVLTDGSAAGSPRTFAQQLERGADNMEGFFAVVRVDLSGDSVTVHTDPLGNLAVYEMVADGTHYVSNSLAAMAALQERPQISLLAASTYLTLGWYLDGHTALEGVRLVGGGTHLTLAPGREPNRRAYYGSAVIASGSVATPKLEGVRDALIGQLQSAATYGSPLRIGLTAGQDSRLCLALALAAGVDVELYTEGARGDLDVDAADAVARHVGLPHEVIPRQRPSSEDAAVVVRTFIGQNDAASSFAQFEDHYSQLEAREPISIKLLGIGGEVARTNTHPIRGFLASGPPIVDLRSVQRSVLARKISLSGGLVRPSARAATLSALDRWFDARRADGWGTRWLAETAYVFDSMVRTHQGSQRRTAGTADLFAPLSSRPFVSHALDRAPRHRYSPGMLEALIASSTPSLLEVRLETPFRKSNAAFAALTSTKALSQLAWARRDGEASGNAQSVGAGSWAEQIDLHLEMVETARDRDLDLFSIVDSDVLIGTLRGARPVTSGTMRALMLIWWSETVARVSTSAALVP